MCFWKHDTHRLVHLHGKRMRSCASPSEAMEVHCCCSGRVGMNTVCNDLKPESYKPLGPSSFGGLGFRTGSRMLQSVPAQVKSQMQVASLLHTCEGEGRDTNENHWRKHSVSTGHGGISTEESTVQAQGTEGSLKITEKASKAFHWLGGLGSWVKLWNVFLVTVENLIKMKTF